MFLHHTSTEFHKKEEKTEKEETEEEEEEETEAQVDMPSPPTEEAQSNGFNLRSELDPSFRDDRRLEQRLKQIAFGKSTIGYQNYVRILPHDERDPTDPHHPVTPCFYDSCSKRMWDANLRRWRRALHYWDPEAVAARETEEEEAAMNLYKSLQILHP